MPKAIRNSKDLIYQSVINTLNRDDMCALMMSKDDVQIIMFALTKLKLSLPDEVLQREEPGINALVVQLGDLLGIFDTIGSDTRGR